MYNKILALVLLLTSSLLAIEAVQPLDCKLHITVTQPTNSQIKIQISHDKNCTIVIEDMNRTITISSDLNQSKVDTNSTLVQNLIELAKSKMGNKYKPAAAGPENFDCSGFMYYVFRSNDILIPRTSLAQSKIGVPLNREEIEIGDLLSFDTSGKGHVNHTGLYLGDGEFIHASSGKAYGVTVSKLDTGFYKDKFLWGIRVEKDPTP